VKVLDFGLAKLVSPAQAGHYRSDGDPIDSRDPIDGSVRLQPDLTASPLTLTIANYDISSDGNDF